MPENLTTRFAERRKLLTVREDALAVASRIRSCVARDAQSDLRDALSAQHPADLADAMQFLTVAEEQRIFALLTIAEAAEVLDEVDATTRAGLIRSTSPERLALILNELPADEGADIVGGLQPGQSDRVLALANSETVAGIRTLLAYCPETAGGIMSLAYVDVPSDGNQAKALERFRRKSDAEHIFFIYVVNSEGGLEGVIDLRTLLNSEADTPVSRMMTRDYVSVTADCDQELVASIFARYDLTALPVVGPDPGCRLLGIITADDIIEVINVEASEDVAHITGSDAEELEKKSPVQVARLRLPWIMATLFIELLAGFVIRLFNPTLDKYLLLASFMPIISAISGNTGLQSAAIIIRGLSSGQIQLSHWKHAVARQVATTSLLGGACAGTLGLIGAIWDKHWSFGLVVFLGMFLSVNIAGIVGTVTPLISKRAGFDPALTAGPFETAFQDVVGISIFLSLAALLLRWLH